MRWGSAAETVILGAITGMRSMSGVAVLALRSDGVMKRVVPVLAVGEMLADKTPFVGSRLDPLPLAGRALMGSLVGYLLARRGPRAPWLGALAGGVAAVAAAHVMYHGRKALAWPNGVAGLVEDALVVTAGLSCLRAMHPLNQRDHRLDQGCSRVRARDRRASPNGASHAP